MQNGKRRLTAHVHLDPTSRGALDTISAVLRAQGGRGSLSDSVRYAAIRVARELSQNAT